MKLHFAFMIFVFGCVSSRQTMEIRSIETLQSEVMSRQVEELQRMDLSFRGTILSVKDTVLESEGVNWKGLNYYFKDSLLFVAETSWENESLISRISVTSHLLKTRDGLGVGEDFTSIKPHIRVESWKDFPDGYVAFKDSSDSRIVYVMNVEAHPELLEGALKIDKIPDMLQVKDVIIVQ